MSNSETSSADIVVSLSRGRYAVMARASALLTSSQANPDGSSGADVQAVSGLLMTALEELKVAEEELRVQNATLEAQRAGVDERTRHYRQLFLDAPVAGLLTDIHGTILEANAEAGAMLRRETRHLERKPVAALVPIEARDSFRQQFNRLSPDDGVRNWRFPISRAGHVPLEVCVAVKLVPDLGPTRSGLLYWVLREAETN
jgi:PAS domain S-box-containing protein